MKSSEEIKTKILTDKIFPNKIQKQILKIINLSRMKVELVDQVKAKEKLMKGKSKIRIISSKIKNQSW